MATGTAMQEVTRTFRAMNTDVLAIIAGGPAMPAAPGLVDESVLPGAPIPVGVAGVPAVSGSSDAEAALAAIESLFATVEVCASRFRPESELSRLNQSAGHPFAASPLLYDLIEVALQAAAATGGAFDPTLLDALEQAGYDRSFEQLPEDRVSRVSAHPASSKRTRWQTIRLDPRQAHHHLARWLPDRPRRHW